MSIKQKKLLMAMEIVKPDDLDGHKLIWSFSSEHMSPEDVPPISALVYGAKRLLLPEMSWESTPDLLDIFSLAEIIRRQALEDATEALEWDEYYRKGGKETADGIPLTSQERKKLRSVVKKASNETIREVYRTVVMQICWAHIHLLRRSSETYRGLHFFRRYFPRQAELKERESQLPLWLTGLSESELISYDATRTKLKDFLQDVEIWEQEYLKDFPDSDEAHGGARATSEYQSLFCTKFPLLAEWSALAGILLRHLDKIQNLVSTLNSVFADGDSSSNDDDLVPGSSISPILRKFKKMKSDPSSSHLGARRDADNDERMGEQNQPEDKKESQESNMSSKISYVDAPSNVIHAPPTSLLQRSLAR